MRVWYIGRALAFQAREVGFDSPNPLCEVPMYDNRDHATDTVSLVLMLVMQLLLIVMAILYFYTMIGLIRFLP